MPPRPALSAALAGLKACEFPERLGMRLDCFASHFGWSERPRRNASGNAPVPISRAFP